MPARILQPLHQDLARTVAVGEPGREHLAERRVLLERGDDLVVDLVGLDELPDLLRQLRRQHRLSCSVQSRSSMIAAAMIEHRMIGHISGPPARTISHIQVTPSRCSGNSDAASYRRVVVTQGDRHLIVGMPRRHSSVNEVPSFGAQPAGDSGLRRALCALTSGIGPVEWH